MVRVSAEATGLAPGCSVGARRRERLYKYDQETTALEITPTISAWKALHNNPEAQERKGGEREGGREGRGVK